jgi:hypothetical protein
MKYLAEIGAGLIAVSFVLMGMGKHEYALGSLVVVGILDLILSYKDRETITQWIHSLFLRQIDVGIMIGLLVLTWWLMGGGEGTTFLPILMGCIIGHLFWNEND